MNLRRLLFLLLSFVIFLAGCNKTVEVESTTTIGYSNTIASSTETTTEEQTTKPQSQYQWLLDNYYTCLNEKWGNKRVMNNGISILVTYAYEGNALDNLGYLEKDLDGDGTNELIIGALGGDPFILNQVIDMFTYKDGQLKKVYESWERSRYYSLSNGQLYNEGSGSAALSMRFVYQYQSGHLEFVEGLIYDGFENRDNPCFKTPQEDLDHSDDEHLSSEEAVAFSNKYEAMKTTWDYTPFSQLYN